MAYEFSSPRTASVKMNVPVTEGGYLAGSGDTPAGQKSFTIAGIKTAATLAECNTVFDAFVGDIAGGSFDSLTATKTVTYGVVEVQAEPEQTEP